MLFLTLGVSGAIPALLAFTSSPEVVAVRELPVAAQALMAARTMDYRSFTNSAILCHFEDPQIDNLVSLLRSIAGIVPKRRSARVPSSLTCSPPFVTTGPHI